MENSAEYQRGYKDCLLFFLAGLDRIYDTLKLSLEELGNGGDYVKRIHEILKIEYPNQALQRLILEYGNMDLISQSLQMVEWWRSHNKELKSPVMALRKWVENSEKWRNEDSKKQPEQLPSAKDNLWGV